MLNNYRFFFDITVYDTENKIKEYLTKCLPDISDTILAKQKHDGILCGYGFFRLSDKYNFILYDKTVSHLGYFKIENNYICPEFISIETS